MNYDRKELVDWVRGIYQNLDDADKQDALRFFPELREDDEDERAAKAIDEIMKLSRAWEIAAKYGLTAGDIRKWLKKQKEQKPAEWSEEDEKVLSQAIETLEHENYSILANKLKSLRPKPHSWSKEDRRMLDIIISELEQEGENVNVPGLYHLEIDFLKSLRPCPSWKPSEEQIKAIESCFCEFGEGCPDEDGLRSLYNDLKKLM